MSEASRTTQPPTTTGDVDGALTATSPHHPLTGGRNSDHQSVTTDQPGPTAPTTGHSSETSLKPPTTEKPLDPRLPAHPASSAFQSLDDRSQRKAAADTIVQQTYTPQNINPGQVYGIYAPQPVHEPTKPSYSAMMADILDDEADELDPAILDEISRLELADREFWNKRDIRSSSSSRKKFSSFARERTRAGFINEGQTVIVESNEFIRAYIHNLQMLVDYNNTHGSKSSRSSTPSQLSDRSKTPPSLPPKSPVPTHTITTGSPATPERGRESKPPRMSQEKFVRSLNRPRSPVVSYRIVTDAERNPYAQSKGLATPAGDEEEERIPVPYLTPEQVIARKKKAASVMSRLAGGRQVKFDQSSSTSNGITVPEGPSRDAAQEYTLARQRLVLPQQEGETLDEYSTRIQDAESVIINWHGVAVSTSLVRNWDPSQETEDDFQARLKVHAMIVDAFYRLNESLQASTRTSTRAASTAQVKEETDPSTSLQFAHQADTMPSLFKDEGGRITIKEAFESRVALQKMRDAELKEKQRTRYDDQGIRFEGANRIPVDIALREFAERTAEKPAARTMPTMTAGAPGEPGGDDDDDYDEYGGPNGPRGPPSGNPFGSGGGGGGRRPPSEPPRGGSVPPNRVHRSLSAPGQNGIRGRTPGLTDVDEQYHDNMVSRLLRIVRQHLAVRLRIPEGTRPRRVDSKTVGTYDGGRTYEELEQWLYNLVIYLQSSQYGGEDRDTECVLSVNEFLGKEPKTWYRINVQDVNRDQLVWTFEQVIVGLYDRFVHASSMQDARMAFYRERYTPAEGVRRFYDALMAHARNMSVFPDAYTLMTTFVTGLPESMSDTLIEEGLDPEKHTMEDFLREALALEGVKITQDLFKKSRKLLVPSASTPAPKATTPDDKGRTREIRMPVVGKAYVPRAQAVNADGTPRVFIQTKKFGKNRFITPAASKPYRRPDVKPKKRTCFTCGKEGHFAAECPEGQKKDFVRAAHTVVPDDGIADDERSDNEDNPPGEDPEDDDEPGYGSAMSLQSVDIHGNAFFEKDSDSDDTDRLHAIREYASTAGGEEVIVEYDVVSSDDEPAEHIACPPIDTFRSIREETIADTGVGKDGKALEHKVTFRKVRLMASKQAKARPEYGPELKECLATFVNVGGCEGLTLWDSGSTTTGMTPAFADVAKIKVFPLINPIVLQLGTIGSRATVNYGSEPPVSLPGFTGSTYMDVANFDRYDIIIGTPFMRMNKVHLDFENNTVVVNGVSSPATRVTLSDTDARLRRYRSIEKPHLKIE